VLKLQRKYKNLQRLTHLIKESSIFDVDFYSHQVKIRFSSKSQAINHFLKVGSTKMISPNYWFDSEYYLAKNADVKQSGMNPFLHYILNGRTEKRQPNPYFQPHYIARQMNKSLNELDEPIYLYHRAFIKRSIPPFNFCPFFDLVAYLKQNSKLANDNVDPFKYFLESEGLSLTTHHPIQVPPLKQTRKIGHEIILTSHEASLTGAPMVILKIGEILAKKYGFEITFILGKGGELEEEFKQFGDVIIIEHMLELDSTLLEDSLKQQLQGDYLFALCNSACSWPIISALKNSIDTPLITLVHEFPDNLGETVVKRIGECSRRIIVPAIVIQQHINKIVNYPLNEIPIFPQGILDSDFPGQQQDEDKKYIREHYGLDENCKIVLACGLVILRKGCDLFIQAAIAFFRKAPSANCVFMWLGEYENNVDKAYVDSLFTDIKYSKMKDKIKFVGAKKNVAPYFNAADVFLMLSRLDPFPSVVLEAMAASLPVICFDTVIGSAEILNESNGIVVPFLCIKSIVDNLLRLFADDSLAADIGNAAKETVKSNFDFHRYVENILTVVAQVAHLPHSIRQSNDTVIDSLVGE
jgi:glycosyltransferase involved in cell wall biosynthesis